MGISWELWGNTVLSEAQGSGAPAGREPTPLPQTPEQQKADALQEHSAGVRKGSWVIFYRANNGLWGLWPTFWSGLPGRAQVAWCPFPTLGTF